MAVTALSMDPCAEMRMTLVSGASCFILRRRSSPSASPSTRSSSTTSGRVSWNRAQASAPEAATPTSNPSSARSDRMDCRIRASSSAIRTDALIWSSHHGDLDLEDGAGRVGAVAGHDAPAVLEQDVLAHREPQAVPLRLGREERLEQLALALGWDAGPAIAHANGDLVAPQAGRAG